MIDPIKLSPIVVSPETRWRFFAKVQRRGPDEHWPWLGGKRQQFRIGEARFQAAQVAWAIEYGPDVPAVVWRKTNECMDALCVNPRHLLGGKHSEMFTDMIERGLFTQGVTKAIRAAIAEAEGPDMEVAARFGVDRHTVVRYRGPYRAVVACPWCKHSFRQVTQKQRFCSTYCRQRHWGARQRNATTDHPSPV